MGVTHGDPGQGSAMPLHGSRHLSDDVAVGRARSMSDYVPEMPGPFETLGFWKVTPCKGGHGSQVGEVRRPGVSREHTLPT